MSNDNNFRYGTYVLVISTYILILLGAYVKAIHAGLACYDWPKCNDSWIPDLSDQRVFAEWFHRLWAMLNGFLLLGIAFMAFQNRKNMPMNYSLSLILIVLYSVQIIFGGLTVLRELEAAVVVAHLGNAVLIIILQMMMAGFTTMEHYNGKNNSPV